MQDNSGDRRPSFETLKSLFEQLPGIAAGIATGKIGGKGLKQLPTKACKICGTGLEYKWQQKLEIGSLGEGLCESCAKQLNDGMVAVTDGQVYAFIRHPDLNAKSGQVMCVTTKTMMLLKAKMHEKKVEKNGHN